MASKNSARSPAKRLRQDSSSPADNFNLPPPTFDLDTWANNYDGALLPLRLSHVAIHCPSLSRQAIGLAISHAKKSKNVRQYTHLCDLAGQLHFKDLGTPDSEWVSRQEEGNKRELSRLEGELRGYKNNLIRESIRMGQEDLATHHLITGGPPPDPNTVQQLGGSGYSAAYLAFSKTRDYCTTPSHMASMMLRLIYTALLQAVSSMQAGGSSGGNFANTLSNCSRLRSSGVKAEEQVKLEPIAAAMSGISLLGQGNYRDAATTFLSTPIAYNTLGAVHGTDFGRAIASANDIAIYGGLCALATMSRQDLIDRVLGGSFRAFLELEPHMRKAISLYTTAKYKSCIDLLHHYYSDWSLDVFLGAASSSVGNASHVDGLFAKIREKSITAYLSSFSEVSLASLASTFPPVSSSPTAMEEEALGLIESGLLDARLDVVNGTIIAPRKELRSGTHGDAARTAEDMERMLLLRLHKVNAVMAGLEVPKPKNGNWAEGGFYQ
ncbi:hypothetical protein LTR56_017500 [Elasticomyces elasticus]|nr:hypothetical protein LTR56_017500 [Elasticomyces elasticus]KAK3665099.1 hypothetical protein LTR22_004155 [Elasticomyces elasticus]KAK4931525.1 hypothetical protein LTR49_001913 [Elasticomyces elasticus]KAK5766684.1 hypothetical protein LTS12_003033 [Elasticomyces elasticus]